MVFHHRQSNKEINNNTNNDFFFKEKKRKTNKQKFYIKNVYWPSTAKMIPTKDFFDPTQI